MVKVLTRGGKDLKSIQRHLDYLDRKGDLEIDTDDGQQLSGKGVEKALLEDWDLDVETDRRRAELTPRRDRSPPKMVHKILFSMPLGTPADKVLDAVKNFAREEFALKHRYAMVLHTDEPHPHVHMVVKAVSEQGVRLNIRKATLRHWRSEFARHLRAKGIAANATDRPVRGEIRTQKTDSIYRSVRGGRSTHMRAKLESVATELMQFGTPINPVGKARLLETRTTVERGWRAVSERLRATGEKQLATDVDRFLRQMPPAQTEHELLAGALARHARGERERTRESLTR